MVKTLSPLRFPRDKLKVCVATNGVAFFMRGSVWGHALFLQKQQMGGMNDMNCKKTVLTIIVLIMSFWLTGCGSGGNRINAEVLESHGFWYSVKVPDNRGKSGQLQILFDDDKNASVFFEDSGGWISGGDCSVKIETSTIVLESIDGDIIETPLADKGSYIINYMYDAKEGTLSMSFEDVQLSEGIAPFCYDLLLN